MSAHDKDKKKDKEESILEQIKEFRDDDETFTIKCAALAEALKSAKNVVAFVGAGVSVAAGCRSFRGADGVWTEELLQNSSSANPDTQKVLAASAKAKAKSKDLAELEPTFTHMFLATLLEGANRNCDDDESKNTIPIIIHVSHIISQNIDGLLSRSGIDDRFLSEVHGNAFVEFCPNKDGKSCPVGKIIRSFDVCDEQSAFAGRCGECLSNGKKMCHCTPRRCPSCGAALKDTLVHFGEKLPDGTIYTALEAAKNADLLLVLGTGADVFPVAKCVEIVLGNQHQVAMVNLMKTSWDSKLTPELRIFHETDRVFEQVAKFLGIRVQEYDPSKSKLIPTSIPRLSKTHCYDGSLHKWKSFETGFDCSVCHKNVKVWCECKAECCGFCCGVE